MPDTFRVEGVDTTYLRFNPNDPKFLQKIKADISAFEEYESEFFDSDISHRKLFSWIVLMYDMQSPLRREIKDLYKRKVYAGNICGLKPNSSSGKYKEYVEDMFVGKDDEINKLIVKYISSFSSTEYTSLMAHITIQNNALERIIAAKADKNDQIMFDTATEKIKSLTNLIYGTGERDEVYEARRALYKQVAYDLSDMRSESVARAIVQDGKLPDGWSPYGDDYTPGDINFVGDDIETARDAEEQLP